MTSCGRGCRSPADIVVRLAGGEYPLAEPFAFDGRDSAPVGGHTGAFRGNPRAGLDGCRWLHLWTGTIRDNVVIDNFSDNDRVMNEGTNIELRNSEENLAAWPPEAKATIDAAGLEPPPRGIRRPG